jgi:hypothetical protein
MKNILKSIYFLCHHFQPASTHTNLAPPSLTIILREMLGLHPTPHTHLPTP